MGGNLLSWTMILALVADGAGPAGAQAALSYVGTWSTSLADCPSSESAFILEPAAMTLPTLSCNQVSYVKDASGWRAFARDCAGEEGDIGTLNFRLLLVDGTLQFAWPDGTKSSKLIRCPK